jgi:hypothetical protein
MTHGSDGDDPDHAGDGRAQDHPQDDVRVAFPCSLCDQSAATLTLAPDGLFAIEAQSAAPRSGSRLLICRGCVRSWTARTCGPTTR